MNASLDTLARMSEPLEEPQDLFAGRRAARLPVPENILLFKRRAAREFVLKSFEFMPHHRFVLIANLGTSATMRINGYGWRFHPGHAFILFPHQFHQFVDFEKEAVNWAFVTFELSDPEIVAEQRHSLYTLDEPALALLRRIAADYRRGLEETAVSDLVFDCAKLLAHLREQARTSRRRWFTDPTPAQQQAYALIGKIQQHLLAAPGHLLTVDTLAAKFGVSESNLRTRFRNHFGLGLGTYLKNFRVHQAIHLIQDPRLSVSAIARQIGFTTLPAFSRFFTEALGVSPVAYRRRFEKQ